MDGQRHDTKEARTGHSGFASCGVKYLNSSVVFKYNFSAQLAVLCPEILARTQSRKTLAATFLDTVKNI